MGFPKGTKFSVAHKTKISAAMKGKRNAWRGGRSIWSGYMRVWNEHTQKYEYEHRTVVEKHIKRKLRKDEVIHHKNRIKTDNRIENLEIMSYGENTSEYQRFIKSLVQAHESDAASCPFCLETGFDLVGLKLHLTNNCEHYTALSVSLPLTRKV